MNLFRITLMKLTFDFVASNFYADHDRCVDDPSKDEKHLGLQEQNHCVHKGFQKPHVEHEMKLR